MPSTIDDLLILQSSMGPEEWRVRSDAAQVVANYLVCHPCVSEVRYPGLKFDPDFPVAANTLRGGFGPYVWFRIVGEDFLRRFDASCDNAKQQVLALEAQLVV